MDEGQEFCLRERKVCACGKVEAEPTKVRSTAGSPRCDGADGQGRGTGAGGADRRTEAAGTPVQHEDVSGRPPGVGRLVTMALGAISAIAAIETQLPTIGLPGAVLTVAICGYLASAAGLLVLAYFSVGNPARHWMIYKVLKATFPWFPALVEAVKPAEPLTPPRSEVIPSDGWEASPH